jgi:hypothetical protein
MAARTSAQPVGSRADVRAGWLWGNQSAREVRHGRTAGATAADSRRSITTASPSTGRRRSGRVAQHRCSSAPSGRCGRRGADGQQPSAGSRGLALERSPLWRAAKHQRSTRPSSSVVTRCGSAAAATTRRRPTDTGGFALRARRPALCQSGLRLRVTICTLTRCRPPAAARRSKDRRHGCGGGPSPPLLCMADPPAGRAAPTGACGRCVATPLALTMLSGAPIPQGASPTRGALGLTTWACHGHGGQICRQPGAGSTVSDPP